MHACHPILERCETPAGGRGLPQPADGAARPCDAADHYREPSRRESPIRHGGDSCFNRWRPPGVIWRIVPNILPEHSGDKNRAKADRVVQAMMKMVKPASLS